MICLNYNAVINATEYCDCDILQIRDPKYKNQYQNFTRTEDLVYSSNDKYHLWWNKTGKTWFWDRLTPSLEENKNVNCLGVQNDKFELFLEVNNGFVSSYTKDKKVKILPNGFSDSLISRCLVVNENDFDIVETCEWSYPLELTNSKIEAPCSIFPFKYNNTEYNNCTNDNDPWCSTSVDVGLKSKTFGFCNEFCEKKDTQGKSDDDITTLVVGISSTILILSSIVMIYYCLYVKRKNGKEEKNTILDGNFDMINSNMVLNEQAEHLSYSGKYEIERSKFEIGQKWW